MPDDPRQKTGGRERRGARLKTKPFADDSSRLREELQRELRKTVAPSLVVILGPDVGARVVLHGSVETGRDPACELPLHDENASWRHARVEDRGCDEWAIVDLGSTNGTDSERAAVRRGHPQAGRSDLHRQDRHRGAERCAARRARRRARTAALDRRSQRALGAPPLRRAARVERGRGARRNRAGAERRGDGHGWREGHQRHARARDGGVRDRRDRPPHGSRHRVARLRHALRRRRVRRGVPRPRPRPTRSRSPRRCARRWRRTSTSTAACVSSRA